MRTCLAVVQQRPCRAVAAFGGDDPLHRTVVLLQGVIIDATCQEEEINGSRGLDIEDGRETEQGPKPYLSPFRALGSSTLTPAGKPGAGGRAAGRRGGSEGGAHGSEGGEHPLLERHTPDTE